MSAPLRRWDDRVVPAAARLLHDTVSAVRRRTNRRGSAWDVARHGVREEPALAGSIAAVLLAALLIAVVGEPGPAERDTATPVPTAPPAIATATVGPAPGASVDAYLARAAENLRRFGQIAGHPDTYAVVDLRRYSTVGSVRRLVGDVPLVRAYARVPSRLPTEVRSLPIASVADLGHGLTTVAAVAAATAKSYRALLHTFHPGSRVDRTTQRRYQQQRRAAVVEAHRLAHPATCRCLFALVVQARYDQLAALAGNPQVRGIDPASPVITLPGLTVRPLEPRFTAVVPRTGAPGG